MNQEDPRLTRAIISQQQQIIPLTKKCIWERKKWHIITQININYIFRRDRMYSYPLSSNFM